MKTVRDACILQENALDIHVSDQIEQLDQLIADEKDGRAFFEKTHITGGMKTLINEGIARLAGKSNQAVFHLKQAMGGGKTHLLVGFGLLAKHAALRKEYCSDVPHVNAFADTKVAAFNGRNNPAHFVWGEIAAQLGKDEQFKKFWVSGPKAPDEKDWIALFEGDAPILILLDELPPYFHYLDTQQVGNGTVADIATRAFANMLTAANRKANVCIVVTDLTASYDSGTKLIHKALEDARQEIGRQEQNITPVDLAGNEIYDILRKRLFKKLPDRQVIEDIAASFGRSLEEATKAKIVNRGAESIADEIVNTYPFHPSLKNLVALFKENEKFKQTRGLMEIVSRLMKSVWERQDNDVYLIGAQHFDFSISDVREKIAEISEMRDAITKDLWDANISSHAQIIDLNTGNDAASRVGSLLLTASLSTAINAVKGLTKEEILECLVTPVNSANEFATAFESLQGVAWYVHHTPEGKYYFDRQENLTKLLQSIAEDAPDNKIDELICDRLKEMFAPSRKTAYDEVLPLPKISEVADKVRKNRVLLIVSPDSKVPPEDVQRLFDSLIQKNNLCILTGDKTQMGSVEKSARQVFAGLKADKRIPKGHPQREELEIKQQQYEQDFTSTVLTLFDKVLFPIERPGKPAQLANKTLDMTRDQKKPFSGEEQIEKTLTKDPLKLYLDIEANFDAIRDKAEDLLWPANQNESRWSDITDRLMEKPGMPWLPPKGIDQLKTLACNRGLWEDLGTGYVTKKPEKKKTSVQYTNETQRNDEGYIRIRINPQNAGPAPRICYAEDGPVSESSTTISEQTLTTKALRVQFLVVDPSNQFETGTPVTWEEKPAIRNELVDAEPNRKVKLYVAPKGAIKYSLDGSEPRNGTDYTDPFDIPDTDVHVRVFAEAEGLETKEDFKFPAKGQKGIRIDDTKPVLLISPRGGKRLDSRTKAFAGLKDAKEKSVNFERVTLQIGQGSQAVTVMFGDIQVDAEYIETVLNTVLTKFDAATPITLTFAKANFHSGHDLKQFADSLGIDIKQEEVEQ